MWQRKTFTCELSETNLTYELRYSEFDEIKILDEMSEVTFKKETRNSVKVRSIESILKEN